MKRFNSLDHFIMSSALFDSAVDDICVQHDIENLSDHDPIFIRLSLSSNVFSTSSKMYHEKVAWHKCTDADFIAYRNSLSALLKDVYLPVDALQCRDPFCVNNEHVTCIHKYANDLTEACLMAAESTLPKTTFKLSHSKRKPNRMNSLGRPVRSRYFGIIFGPLLDVLKLGHWLTSCVGHERPIIMRSGALRGKSTIL